MKHAADEIIGSLPLPRIEDGPLIPATSGLSHPYISGRHRKVYTLRRRLAVNTSVNHVFNWGWKYESPDEIQDALIVNEDRDKYFVTASILVNQTFIKETYSDQGGAPCDDTVLAWLHTLNGEWLEVAANSCSGDWPLRSSTQTE